MKAIICGVTGMVGRLVLDYCINSNKITEVISLVRTITNISHPKLKEVIISDFISYDDRASLFKDVSVAYFCLGVYTGAVSDDDFKRITVDYAVNFAKLVQLQSPDVSLCLLSGAGADRTEKSRTSFAKYKGMAENQIAALRLKFHVFRPGYIYPVTTRKEPNAMYRFSRRIYPLVKLLGKNVSITSIELARAIFEIGLSKSETEIFENKDILKYLETIK